MGAVIPLGLDPYHQLFHVARFPRTTSLDMSCLFLLPIPKVFPKVLRVQGRS